MPIDSLLDLRNTVATYVGANVDVTIREFEAVTGNTIDPGEDFKVPLEATNTGDVNLVNVTWFVEMVTANAETRLVAPDQPMIARTGPTEDSPVLTPGDEVEEMYLFPERGRRVLEPGETNVVKVLAHGPSDPAGESVAFQFKILADVDEAWLFPVDNPAGPTARAIAITG